MGGQQRIQLLAQRVIALTGLIQKSSSLLRFLFKCRLEQLLDFLKLLRLHDDISR